VFVLSRLVSRQLHATGNSLKQPCSRRCIECILRALCCQPPSAELDAAAIGTYFCRLCIARPELDVIRPYMALAIRASNGDTQGSAPTSSESVVVATSPISTPSAVLDHPPLMQGHIEKRSASESGAASSAELPAAKRSRLEAEPSGLAVDHEPSGGECKRPASGEDPAHARLLYLFLTWGTYFCSLFIDDGAAGYFLAAGVERRLVSLRSVQSGMKACSRILLALC